MRIAVKVIFGGLLLLSIMLSSCAPNKSSQVTQVPNKLDGSKQYDVVGVGDEYFEARNRAIIDGLAQASVDIVGREKFEVNKDLIFKEAKDRGVVKKLVEFHSTELGSKGDKKLVKGYVIVDMSGLREFLNSLPLVESKVEEAKPKEKELSVLLPVVKDKGEGKEEEEKEFELKGDSPIKDMVFLVLPPNEKLSSLQNDEDLKLFIEMVNAELSRLGLNYIDLNRVIELSKKFSLIYEEKTGESMSVAQLVAQEVKAPVYLEVDVNFDPKFVSGDYVDLATSATVKAYDSSTGKGLGVVPFSKEIKSGKGLNQTKTDAMKIAAKIGVNRILNYAENYFSSGISISVKVVGFKGIAGEKDFSTFLDSLPGVNSKKRKSISGSVAEYEINYKGGVSSFVDDLIDKASMDPKYSGIDVDQSGNLVIITIK